MTVLLNPSACLVLKATIKSVDSALTCTALSAFTAALVIDAKSSVSMAANCVVLNPPIWDEVNTPANSVVKATI